MSETVTETSYGPGVTGASDPNVPGVPTFSANGSGSITIAFTANGNDAVVTYALRATYAGPTVKYVQADGTLGVGEIFRTLAAWGATVTVTGLTDFVGYTFAAKARNELAVDSAYSAESASMNTLPDIDYGYMSDNLAREVTGGNTKVDATTGLVISGNTVPEASVVEYYGDIIFTYKLQNNASGTSSIEVQFSEDSGGTWATATKGTGGDAKTNLTSSPTGVTHAFHWASYDDSGESEYQTDARVRIRALDQHGDPGAYVESADFTVNNRPGKITWLNSDGYSWDEDTTPTFNAIIPYLRGGSKGFPEIYIYESDGTTLVSGYPKKAIESIVGWDYENAPSTWVALTATGIPDTVIDGINRLRYTVQTALSAAEYIVAGRLGETRNLS
jgi:hypothetical protein